MLSLQSSKISLSSGLLGCSSFSLLYGLSSKEFLLHLLGFKLLSCFLLLKFFQFRCSSRWLKLFLLSLLFCLSNFTFELLILFNLNHSLLFLSVELFEKGLLLWFLSLLQIQKCFASAKFATLHKSLRISSSCELNSLSMCLLSSLLERFFHCC